MPATITQLLATQTSQQWLSQLLTDANTLGLNATAWQVGQVVRTVLAILAVELNKEDAAISLQTQGGLLDFAASGSVTITDLNGNTTTVPVTPDPSVAAQNPSGAPGWLDATASSTFNVLRNKATPASGTLQLANTSGVTIGVFAPGTFHVQNAFTASTYSNQSTFTFAPSTAIGGNITSVAPISPVQVQTSVAHGLSTGAVVFVQRLKAAIDNFYSVTVIDATHFSLNGSTFSGTPYGGSGGAVWSTMPLPFASDILGPGGNAGIYNINQLITAAPQCFCSNLATFAGAPWQSNASLAAACRGKLATLSPNGPRGAYLFYALVAYLILSGQTAFPIPAATVTAAAQAYLTAVGQPALANPLPANFTLDGGPITRVVVQPNVFGQVVVVVANATGPVAGIMGVVVSNMTAANPIVATTAAPHNLVTGDWVQVNLAAGLTGANGVFQCTRIDATNISLNGSTGVGAYVANSATLSGGDLYAVDAVLHAYCTPNGVRSSTRSANSVPVTVAATVYVPSAFVGDYITKMTAALIAYVGSFPLGGLDVDQQSAILPLGAIEGVLFAAGQNNGVIYTLSVANPTLNGFATDLFLGGTGVAQLGTLAGIVVVGV